MRVPLHPGTHLNDVNDMKRLQDIWEKASEEKRRVIVNNIFYEIESFKDCYTIESVLEEDS